MALLETLTDDFATANTAKWHHPDTGATWQSTTVTGGQLVMDATDTYAAKLRSVDTFDFTDSWTAVEIAQLPLAATGLETYFGLHGGSEDTYLTWIITGQGGWVAVCSVDGVDEGSTFGTYDATAHKWLRIRHRGPKFYFEASPDGRTWQVLFSLDKPAGFDITECWTTIETGDYVGGRDAGQLKIESYSLPPFHSDVLTVDTNVANTTAASCVVTTSAEYPAGSTVVVVGSSRNPDTAMNLSDYFVTDSAGNTYALDIWTQRGAAEGGDNGGLAVYRTYLEDALPAGSTVVFGRAGARKLAVVVLNMTNIAEEPLDVAAVNPTHGDPSPTGGTYSSGATATTTLADAVAIGAATVFINTTGNINAPTGWAENADVATTGGTNTTNARAQVQHKGLAATQTVTNAPTGTSRQYRSAVVVYKLDDGSGGEGPTIQTAESDLAVQATLIATGTEVAPGESAAIGLRIGLQATASSAATVEASAVIDFELEVAAIVQQTAVIEDPDTTAGGVQQAFVSGSKFPCEQWFWIGKRGSIDLSDFVDGVDRMAEIEGRGALQVRQTTITIPGEPGQYTTDIQHAPREMAFPLHARGSHLNPLGELTAADQEELLDVLTKLITIMDPVGDGSGPDAGVGILRLIRRDGSVFELNGRVLGDGLHIRERTHRFGFEQIPLVIVADDPYWYSEARTKTFYGAEPRTWFPMIRAGEPWLASSAILGTVALNVESDVPTDPIWTVTGPGSAPVITNLDNPAETIQFKDTMPDLAEQESMVINTTEGTVTGPDGDDWFKYLLPGSRQMFPLRPGTVNLELGMTGSDSTSSIAVTYRNRQIVPRITGTTQTLALAIP